VTNSWEQLVMQSENEWLAYPEVREALAKIAARIDHTPESLLRKGFASPHWWMTENSWSEFLGKGHASESLLNAVALLQLNVPLHDLTQRVADGDPHLYVKLFRIGDPDVGSERILDTVVQPLSDQATRIVGRALLRKGEPPGYQLPLRMVLFFGWDFGLCDLSIRELHNFLVQMNIVPNFYDPETLRKYRDRLRSNIRRASRRQLSQTSRPTIQEP